MKIFSKIIQGFLSQNKIVLFFQIAGLLVAICSLIFAFTGPWIGPGGFFTTNSTTMPTSTPNEVSQLETPLTAQPDFFFQVLIDAQDTSKPIKSAKATLIFLNQSDMASEVQYSDDTGLVSFNFPENLQGQRVNLKIEADDYQVYDQQIVLTKKSQRILLVPIENNDTTPVPINTITPTITITPATQSDEPTIEEWSVFPTQITQGQSVNIRWQVTNAEVVMIYPLGQVPISGTQKVTPTQTTTYQLSIIGPDGPIERTQRVEVKPVIPNAPKINLFTVQPNLFVQGETSSIHLTWETQGADRVTIEPGLGTVSLNGELDLQAPNTNTIYTLIAENIAGEAQAQVQVNVVTPTPRFTGDVISFPATPTFTPTPNPNPQIPPALVNPTARTNIYQRETSFTWEWDGQLREGQSFEVRIWQDGSPHFGAYDAVETRTDMRDNGDGSYTLSFDVESAFWGNWQRGIFMECGGG